MISCPTSSHTGPIGCCVAETDANNVSEMMNRIRLMIERHAPLMMKVGGGHLGRAYKPRKHLTKPIQRQILRLGHEGMPFAAIAEKTGASESSVGRICRENGIRRTVKGNGCKFRVL